MYKLILIAILLLPSCLFTQQEKVSSKNEKHDGPVDEVLFYNVENLFDTEIDSTRTYNEFSPDSKKKWDKYKFKKKINEIAKCITAATEDGAEFIGLAEIENELVLQKLISHPLLFPYHYEIMHFESRDVRGIDVALLYKSKTMDLLSFKKVVIQKKRRPTRDILIVVGIHKQSKDTLAFFVNHWSSRWGGKKKSEKSRVLAAVTLQYQMDSLRKKCPSCKIIAMGDFNDSPKDSSINKVLDNINYVNLFKDSTQTYGSLKYKRKWQVFDQFVVSKNLLENTGVTVNNVTIFSPSWLLENDKKYGGQKPFRTYYGPRYHGGISDHLPVVLRLKY
ncbi:MAG: putative extracellular nuclease [Saprospiraceae bacterium]